MKLSNINQRFITPFIGTVANTFYKNLRGKDTEWDYFIDQTQYILNLRLSDTTKSTPFSLMIARRPNYFKDFNNETTLQEISEKEPIQKYWEKRRNQHRIVSLEKPRQNIVKRGGLSGMYSGHLGTMLRETVGCAAWFAIYESMMGHFTRMHRVESKDQLSAWTMMLAGKEDD
ncbi:hypothetical protein O9G_000194 [Rozella allomycis CSF55]|uniref:Uncharacterized protein n=1 Tax=Rozella allomycis (strain CSF55) TaxID=988480 RepID=A0A075ANZ5_ROZAC|nr:hypothetical protein O9G_000194 [Rozella allomycis CSF55]|eukprot:EPZ31715.1 hypothetical protein O9G_000194 [Rozella allomycis CSF55]